MKQLFATIVALTIVCNADAQKVLGTYHSSYFNQDYSVGGTAKGAFAVDCAMMEGARRKAGLWINSSEVEAFRTALIAVQAKYLEWSQLAKDNNVTDLNKDIPVVMPKTDVFFTVGELHFTFEVRLTPRFTIMDDGSHLAILNSGECTSSSNRFIKTEGVLIAFQSADDFNSLIALLDPAKLEELNSAKKSTEDIFK